MGRLKLSRKKKKPELTPEVKVEKILRGLLPLPLSLEIDKVNLIHEVNFLLLNQKDEILNFIEEINRIIKEHNYEKREEQKDLCESSKEVKEWLKNTNEINIKNLPEGEAILKLYDRYRDVNSKTQICNYLNGELPKDKRLDFHRLFEDSRNQTNNMIYSIGL